MFGIGHFPELMIVLVIALIVFGPGKLPEMGRSLGRAIRGFRETSAELERTFSGAFLDTPLPTADTIPMTEPVATDLPVSSIPSYTPLAAVEAHEHLQAAARVEGVGGVATHEHDAAVPTTATPTMSETSHLQATPSEPMAIHKEHEPTTAHTIESPTMFSAHVPTGAEIAPTHTAAVTPADPVTPSISTDAAPTQPAPAAETFLTNGAHPRQRVRRIVLHNTASPTGDPIQAASSQEPAHEATTDSVVTATVDSKN